MEGRVGISLHRMEKKGSVAGRSVGGKVGHMTGTVIGESVQDTP